ncbi:PCIF1 WW domain-containing protein [Plasmodiophora brassicae]
MPLPGRQSARRRAAMQAMQFSNCIGLQLQGAVTAGADLDRLLLDWRSSHNVDADMPTNCPVVRERHPVSPVPPSVDSVAVDRFWDDTTVCCHDPDTCVDIGALPNPSVEISRQQAISRMRSSLSKWVKTNGNGDANAVPDNEVFDKWIFTRQALCNQGDMRDPMIPCGHNALLDETLIGDLSYFMDPEPASHIARRLGQLGRQSVNALTRVADQPSGQVAVKCNPDGHVHVKCGRTVTKVSPSHYVKLKSMYRGKPSEFNTRLFALLMRYVALSDTGMQAACNEDVFRVLLADFDVRMECFASPMNCHFTRQYCSAFPDVDTVFGSRGSFFAFRPVSGSFHANPPFIDDIIERMARHMDELLAGTSQPLSFIVVVPHRAKTSAWKVLSSSVHNRYHLLLKQKAHGFCEGAQHRRSSRFKVSSCDSSIIFLQNDPGAHKYKVTDERIERLRLAFASRQASEREQQYRKRKRGL